MTIEQWLVLSILLLTLILFVSARLRYDIIALLALLAVTLAGIIPVERAFLGFSNPAVITVAAVLILSRGLQNSGVVEWIGNKLTGLRGGLSLHLLVLTTLIAILSAFMNNVGALALLLPVTLTLARKKGFPASKLLMPLAFASLLGGMTTLIGTPPNLIASAFRQQSSGLPFRMFDFLPVGGAVALSGVLFLSFVGWRFIPLRHSRSTENTLEIEDYVTEVRLRPTSPLIGKALHQTQDFSNAEVIIIGLVRGQERRMEPSAQTVLQAGDILILKADIDNIRRLTETLQLELVGSQPIGKTNLQSEDVILLQVVIMPNSVLQGNTARSLSLRSHYGINLLAISRQGQVQHSRLDRIRFRTGDVLLIQSHIETASETLQNLGCLPLAGQNLKLRNGTPRRWPALALFCGALLIAALGLLPSAVSFTAAAVLMVLLKVITLNEAYQSIDWPIVILLGAMIPVGEALEISGTAGQIANLLLQIAPHLSAGGLVAILLVVTMFLSDVINNAAALVLMAPIGISVAQGLGVSVDPFLMAITIGASCAFLTPIGHQSNTLVMGPGGYAFSDYWRAGLLLEVIVALVSIPLLLLFWPL